MRVLILSCNTGEGHNSAAKALNEVFQDRGVICEIADALAFWSVNKSKMISKGHTFVYRKMPKLFGATYRFEENHPPKNGEDSFIYELVTRGCSDLYEFLSEKPYDAVICTHVFPSMMVTELKRQGKINVKCYFVATDYTCSPGVGETEMDGYFIPHKYLRDEFVGNGLSFEKLIPSGIPVKKAFNSSVKMSEAKRKVKIPQCKKAILLTCGSMGCGPIKELCEMLPEKLGADAMLVVICGNNRKLYNFLTKNKTADNLKVIGYTVRMPLYMDAASLILTKPGGLSSTEAAVKGLPMIFIDAVPGCETRNIDFFLKYGLAEMGDSAEELCNLVCRYINDSEKRNIQKERLKAEFSANAAENICNYIIRDVNFDG